MRSLLLRRLPQNPLSALSPLSFSTTTTITTKPQHYTAVLNLSQTSTLSDVKASFRALAKIHHPDANNPSSSPDAFQSILAAYQEALEEYDDYNGFTPTSGKLAVAAEVFTVEEMESMEGYDVHAVRVALEEAAALAVGEDAVSDGGEEVVVAGASSLVASGGSRGEPPAVVRCSLYDSVSDLKRALQSFHPPLLALSGRKLDRDGLYVGWDVLHEGRAMGGHLFLEDYGVEHGDVMHVVVDNGGAREDGEEREFRRRKRELKQRSRVD